MKNIIKYIILTIMTLSFTWVLEVSASTTTQNFPSVKLRHWYTYNFFDVVNSHWKYIFVSDFNGSTFSERHGDYNGANNPNFGFTSSFLAKEKQVNPYTSERAFESKSGYSINFHPNVRKFDNLFIKYQMQYYTWEWTEWSWVKTHIENQPYEITWCGDGVKDNYIDQYSWNQIYETCDPNDSSKSGWGTGWCSNSCQPVISQPVCNNLTIPAPFIIEAPADKIVSCTATNATKITIDCGNGSIQDFTGNNSSSKTVSKTCNYITAGTYIPKCFVNDTITNLSCQKTLSITNSNSSIDIIKTDFNTGDKDTVIGNDSQTVIRWDKAIFKIIVRNNGTEDLNTVIITDPLEPNCNRTALQTRELYTGNVFAVWDSFEYVCEKVNTQNNYTNIANVTWIGVISNINVNDTDPTDVIISDVDFDLALRKTVTSTWPYNIWDIVEYNIEVINQWDVTATGVIITDYIPANMELVFWNDWSTMDTTTRETTNTISTVVFWITQNLTIRLRILAWATWTITNYAEISADNWNDCDSTADSDNTNDWSIIDNNIGGRCDSTTNDEDDHDLASILIWNTVLSCQATTTWTQSSEVTSVTAGLCKNVWETVENFNSTISWNITNYTWACKDTNNVVKTGWNCSASYTTSGWGGWWGSDAQCFNIIKNNDNYTCKGNFEANHIWIDCDWDGKYEQVGTSNSNNEATFTCNTTTLPDWTVETPTPRCWVSEIYIAPDQQYGWTTSNQCIIGDWTCGNGIVEAGEQCDLGSNNWTTSACSSACKLHIKNVSCSTDMYYYNLYKEGICKFITTPSAWEISITNVSNFAIWNNKNVFIEKTSPDWFKYYEFNTDNVLNNRALFIKNIWSEPMYFEDRLCLIDRWNKGEINYWDTNFNGDNRNILSDKDEYCEQSPIWFLYPGEVKYLDPSKLISWVDVENMKWDTSSFWSERIKTSHLVLTIKNWMATYDWSPILSGHMFITVAKPTIAIQWGWTSFIANSNKITNINKIAKKVAIHSTWNNWQINQNQNNFVATVLGDWSNLSNVDTLSWALKNKAVVESTELENNADSVFADSSTSRTNLYIYNFGSYRWIDNVYFVKDTNITLPATSFMERKTYIIENGDLIIEWNIDSSKNIAFIVKNGNVIIKNNVTKIDATIVSIGDLINTGFIKWDTTSTNEQLLIEWTLYGDTNDLVSKRTHISMDSQGNISVWTLVSFGSNILSKPAPLVGQFIREYHTSTKIAR